MILTGENRINYFYAKNISCKRIIMNSHSGLVNFKVYLFNQII